DETVADLDIGDPAAVARHATRERYGLVVIGPEGPLAAGVGDALRSASVPAFGPGRDAARLESSKAYAKRQMARAGVPTASAATFREAAAAVAHARAQDRPPVVKADWLAAGKGVVVPETHDEAEEAIHALLAGAGPGASLVLEERLIGREVSVFALVSGEAVAPLAAACDYKRLGDGEIGPNTGGMGAHAPVPWFGAREVEACTASVFEPIAWRMARDGTPYRGVLYAGLMVTDAGPMVLEFNARFGDPEAQVLLPLLNGQLTGALLGAATGDAGLMAGSVAIGAGAAVGVVLASEGYPDDPTLGRRLTGADPSGPQDDGPVLRFHAGTRATPEGYLATGGRVATIVGLGPDLAAARREAYAGLAGAGLEGGQHRTDVGERDAGDRGAA
ncbi:MAG: phosphoribosylamine--glycine ligase, partial [Candidatus Limnocylindria bacterium]